MLGKLHEKYLSLSRLDVDYRSQPAPYGRCFGVPVKSAKEKLTLQEEEKFHTAQDLGYE